MCTYTHIYTKRTFNDVCAKKIHDKNQTPIRLIDKEINYIQLQQPVIVQYLHTHTHKHTLTHVHKCSQNPVYTHTQAHTHAHTYASTDSELSDDSVEKLVGLSPAGCDSISEIQMINSQAGN